MVFKYLDLLGNNIHLHFEKKQIARTYIGAITTLLIAGFVIYIAYYFSKDMIYRTNPSVFVNEMNVIDTQFPQKELIMALDFINADGSPLKNKEKYITIIAASWETHLENGASVYSVIEPTIERCDPNKHFKSIEGTTEM